MDHPPAFFAPLVILAIFVILALRRQIARAGKPPAQAARTAAPPQAAPARKRLVTGPSAAPARPAQASVRPATASARPATRPPARPPAPSIALEAAAAFPAVDLSLGGDAPAGAPAARRPRLRSSVAGAALGSRGWAANAVVALEVLGPPVGLRAGATLGLPHAL